MASALRVVVQLRYHEHVHCWTCGIRTVVEMTSPGLGIDQNSMEKPIKWWCYVMKKKKKAVQNHSLGQTASRCGTEPAFVRDNTDKQNYGSEASPVEGRI